MSALAHLRLDRRATIVGAVLGSIIVVATVAGAWPISTGIVLVGFVAIVIASLGCPRRVAWWWGVLLPIDAIGDVPALLLHSAQYGGLLWLVWSFSPSLDADRRRQVVRLALLVAAVGIVREVGSLARADRFGIFIAAVMVLGAATAPLVAERVRAHRPLMAGFMAGVLLSAVVSIMQSFDIGIIREGNSSGERFPGFASTTMLLTWHLAFALIIACYFLLSRPQQRLHRLTAVVLVPLAVVALVGNGAQGGLLGLGAAGAFIAWRGRKMWTARSVRRILGTALLGTVAIGVVVVAAGISTPTIDGLLGQGDYRNELGRLEVNAQGFRTLVEHPLVGTGRTNFEDQYDLAPHFLPLEAGVTSGVIGFLLGTALLVFVLILVLRGPVGRRPEAWLGAALGMAMWSNTLIETGGPVTGLPRFSLLLIALVACLGEPWPEESAPRDGRDQEPLAAPSDASTSWAARSAAWASMFAWWSSSASRLEAAQRSLPDDIACSSVSSPSRSTTSGPGSSDSSESK